MKQKQSAIHERIKKKLAKSSKNQIEQYIEEFINSGHSFSEIFDEFQINNTNLMYKHTEPELKNIDLKLYEQQLETYIKSLDKDGLLSILYSNFETGDPYFDALLDNQNSKIFKILEQRISQYDNDDEFQEESERIQRMHDTNFTMFLKEKNRTWNNLENKIDRVYKDIKNKDSQK